MDVGRKRFKRLDGGIHIGGFGIVVVVNISDCGHVLQPVFDCLEIFYRLSNLLRRAAHERACADTCQNVLDVVRTFQWNFRYQHEVALPIGCAEEDASIAYESAMVHFFLSTEPENLGFRSCRQRYATGIVSIQHCKIIRLLVLEDPSLCIYIGFEGSMTIKMVRSDVQNYRYFGPEGLDGFQLKTGNLEHNQSIWFSRRHQRYCRSSDISPDQGWETSSNQDFPSKGRGRSLAVGAGDGNNGPWQKLSGQFDLANHRNAERTGLHNRWRVHRHAWTDDDQVLPVKGTVAVPASFNRNAVIEQHRNRRSQFVFCFCVGHGHACAPRFEKQSRGCARFAQADDEHAFAV